jgi:F420-dependent oxidoreductase-like protein
VSHKPVIEGMLGMPYAAPAAHTAEYLQVLVPLLRGEEVNFAGQFYTVNGGFTVLGNQPVSVVVGALGARMVDVAGEFSDGTVTWLAGPRSLEHDICPRLRAAADRAGRGAPRVIAGVPIAVCDDIEEGREQVSRTFARYGTLDNYRRLFEREGVDSVADLAIIGPEPEVEKGLRRLADAGATELWPSIVGVGPDVAGSKHRTLALLASLGPDL